MEQGWRITWQHDETYRKGSKKRDASAVGMKLTWYILVPSSTHTQHWQERFYLTHSFKLTGGNLVPFNIDGNEDSSKEESRLFKNWAQKYKRHIAPGQKRDIMHSQRVDAGREPTAERFQDETVSSHF
jgi:hypothetical protein